MSNLSTINLNLVPQNNNYYQDNYDDDCFDDYLGSCNFDDDDYYDNYEEDYSGDKGFLDCNPYDDLFGDDDCDEGYEEGYEEGYDCYDGCGPTFETTIDDCCQEFNEDCFDDLSYCPTDKNDCPCDDCCDCCQKKCSRSTDCCCDKSESFSPCDDSCHLEKSCKKSCKESCKQSCKKPCKQRPHKITFDACDLASSSSCYQPPAKSSVKRYQQNKNLDSHFFDLSDKQNINQNNNQNNKQNNNQKDNHCCKHKKSHKHQVVEDSAVDSAVDVKPIDRSSYFDLEIKNPANQIDRQLDSSDTTYQLYQSKDNLTIALLVDDQNLKTFNNLNVSDSFIDVLSFNNHIYILGDSGFIYRLDSLESSPVKIRNSVKLEKITNFEGYLYGLSGGSLYLLNSRSYDKTSWQWSLVKWAPKQLKDLTSTLDGSHLWLAGCGVGYLFTLSNASHNDPVLVRQESIGNFKRVFSMDAESYLDVYEGDKMAIQHPSGDRHDNVCGAILTHNGDILRIPQELSHKIKSIKIVNWEPVYLITKK